MYSGIPIYESWWLLIFVNNGMHYIHCPRFQNLRFTKNNYSCHIFNHCQRVLNIYFPATWLIKPHQVSSENLCETPLILATCQHSGSGKVPKLTQATPCRILSTTSRPLVRNKQFSADHYVHITPFLACQLHRAVCIKPRETKSPHCTYR